MNEKLKDFVNDYHTPLEQAFALIGEGLLILETMGFGNGELLDGLVVQSSEDSDYAIMPIFREPIDEPLPYIEIISDELEIQSYDEDED